MLSRSCTGVENACPVTWVQLGNLLTKCVTDAITVPEIIPAPIGVDLSLKQASEYCVTITPTYQLFLSNSAQSPVPANLTLRTNIQRGTETPIYLPNVIVTVVVPHTTLETGVRIPLSGVWTRDLEYGDYSIASVIESSETSETLSVFATGELSVVASVTRF